MAMTKTPISANAWTPVITGSTVDTFLAITDGPARLCFGPVVSTPVSVGADVGVGYQVIVPAGVDVSAVSVGGTSSAITGPFGV